MINVKMNQEEEIHNAMSPSNQIQVFFLLSLRLLTEIPSHYFITSIPSLIHCRMSFLNQEITSD